jgi:hypothetical protein
MFFAVPAWTAEGILGTVKHSVMSCPVRTLWGTAGSQLPQFMASVSVSRISTVDCDAWPLDCIHCSPSSPHWGRTLLNAWLQPLFPQQPVLIHMITHARAGVRVHTHTRMSTIISVTVHKFTWTSCKKPFRDKSYIEEFHLLGYNAM